MALAAFIFPVQRFPVRMTLHAGSPRGNLEAPRSRMREGVRSPPSCLQSKPRLQRPTDRGPHKLRGWGAGANAGGRTALAFDDGGAGLPSEPMGMGFSPVAIAAGLKRSPSTISRELRRNGYQRPEHCPGERTVAGRQRLSRAPGMLALAAPRHGTSHGNFSTPTRLRATCTRCRLQSIRRTCQHWNSACQNTR